MSVINDMLKDLEARKAPEREGYGGANRSLIAPEDPSVWQQHKRLLVFVLLVLLVLVIGVAVGAYLISTDRVSNSVARVNTSEMDAPLGVSGSAESFDAQPALSSDRGTQEASLSSENGESNRLADGSGDKYAIDKQIVAKVSAVKNAEEAERSVPEKAVVVATSQPAESKPSRTEKSSKTTSAASINTTERKAVQNSDITQRQVRSASEPLQAKQTQENRVADREAKSQSEVKQTNASAQVVLTPLAKDQTQAEQAQAMIEQGRERDAIRALYQFIEANEQDDYSRVVLASTLMLQGRDIELRDLLNTVTTSSLPELRQLKARWYVTQGQLAMAVHSLKTDAPEVSGNEAYFALLASYQQQLGQFEQSVDTYSALLERDSSVPEWWVGMAIGLDRLARYQNAALAYKQALTLPDLKPALVQFAQQRYQQLARVGQQSATVDTNTATEQTR